MDVDAGRSEHSLPSPRQLKKLLKVYSQKLRQNPDDLDLRIKLAEVLRLLGRVNEAIAFYSSIAWAYGVAGNLGQAITLCKIILELNPNHSETQQMLAKLYASQRIREEKQSVPVVMVEGRWIADPKTGVSKVHASGPSQPYEAQKLGQDVRGAQKDDTVEDASKRTDDEALADDLEDFDEEEELTSDERPPRAPSSGGQRTPDAVARRRSGPTSFELPPHRSPKSPEHDQASRPAAPKQRKKPSPPRPLDPEPLPEPAGTGEDWLAMAPTKRAIPEDFTGSDQPVVVTTDKAGKLTIDPNAARQQPPNKHTLKISADEATRLRDDKQRRGAAGEAAGGQARSPGKRTAPMPAAAQRRKVAQSIAGTPAPIMPGRRPAPAPAPPEPRGDDAVDAEEPTQFEKPVSSGGAGVKGPPEKLTLEQSAETVVGEPAGPDAVSAPVPALDPRQKAPASLEGHPETAPGVVEEEPTHLEDEEVAARSEEVAEEPTNVDDLPPAVSAEAPSPPAQGPPAPGKKVETSTERLSTAQMMERLSAMGAVPSRESQPIPAVSSTAASPPPPDGPAAAEEAAGKPIKRHSTAPGFQSTGEFVPPAPRDPLRFLRTTRRYASVEIPPDDEGDDQTAVQSLDPELVSSVMRMDAASSMPEPKRSSKGYAAIQREVRRDGRKQEDLELPAAEVEAAVEDLRDTFRELPGGADPLSLVKEEQRTPFPLFSDLDTGAFLAMVEKLERRECAAGSLVFQEGDPGDSLYLVSSGTLQVLKSDEEDRQIELAKLGAGSFFGEFGLLTDRRRHASVRCLDDCELLELRREVLAELIQQHPSVSWTLRIFYQQRLMAMVLATSPLFQAVSPEDRRAVLSRFTIRRILEGETIIEEGKPTNGFYVILVGEVSIACIAEDGLEVPLGMLSEGDYFGEISLLTGSFPAATVKANQLTEVLTLNARDFYDLTTTHPEIWAEVQRKAEVRQQETAARLAKRNKAAGPIPLI